MDKYNIHVFHFVVKTLDNRILINKMLRKNIDIAKF